MMDGGVVIAMDSGTGNGQRWCKWAVRQRDGGVAMDGTMEGGGSPPRQKRHNGRMTAAAIMMDGSSKIVMDCGSGDKQQRHVIFLNNEWTGIVEVKHPLVCGWLG
jgi:hypothetical protein